MTEIGGYFGLESLIHNEYYPNLIAVNNARNALLYILKAKKIKKIYIPYFLCDSVSSMCDREGYGYEYYNIGPDFMPIFDRELENDQYIYIVNYYGQIDNVTINCLKEKYRNIIVDNVQAFFAEPVEGVDTVYSCRKFFGVPDGGYVSTNAMLDEKIDIDISKDRMAHILGRYEGNASDYYSDFKNNDGSFDKLELRYMSKLTHNILGAIDYEYVKRKREENFAFLAEMLGDKNPLGAKSNVGPYAYPFYIKNGIKVKRALAEKKIYVPTLWPNVLDMDGTLEKDYAENILPLPVDQRYSREDMERIVYEVRKCIN